MHVTVPLSAALSRPHQREASSPFLLLPADLPIIALLARHRLLTAEQVQRGLNLSPKSASYPRRRLKPLQDKGYVTIPPEIAAAARAGQTKAVYLLTAKGYQLAKKLGFPVPERWRSTEQHPVVSFRPHPRGDGCSARCGCSLRRAGRRCHQPTHA